MSGYDVRLVETKLMRPGKGFFKVYFFQNEARGRLWTPDDIEYVGEQMEQSLFTQNGMGVICSFAPKEGGISKVVYFYPDMNFLTTEPLCFRNPDFREPDLDYPKESTLMVPVTDTPESQLNDTLDVPVTRIALREGYCWGEAEAALFELRQLSELGEAEYRTRMNTTFFKPRATGTGRLTHRADSESVYRGSDKLLL